MNRNNRAIWSKRIAFPLERLFAMIQNGIWSDVESEQLWSRGETLPYQVWETDPTITMAFLRLQPVEMACAWCSQMESFLIEEFCEMHVTKVAELQCSSCRRKFDADRLSAKYFKDDLAGFMKLHRPWYPQPLSPSSQGLMEGISRVRFPGHMNQTPKKPQKRTLDSSSNRFYIIAIDP